jgi:hypothetical protein
VFRYAKNCIENARKRIELVIANLDSMTAELKNSEMVFLLIEALRESMNTTKLTPKLETAVREFDQWWDDEQKALSLLNKVSAPLYHYTDAAGLAGIIRSQEIWFTSAYHLNDPSEFTYGTNLAIEVLEECKVGTNEIIQKFCDHHVSVLRDRFEDMFGFYVSCFSYRANDLGQWRAYGDNGRGFSLGLAPRLFDVSEELKLQTRELAFIGKVSYSREQTVKLMRSAATKALDIIEEALPTIDSDKQLSLFLQEMSVTLSVPFIWYAITSKHFAYANEDEVRLILLNSSKLLAPEIEFRTRGSNLIPFIRSPLAVKSTNSIVEIVVGPSADPTAEDSIRTLLYSQGLPIDLPIRRSDIPYRAR